jgi:hypothetical protein
VEPHVDKLTKDESAYFTVWWSALVPLTKRAIAGRVPSLPGIFEVYSDQRGRRPELVGRNRAYYGGLRNTFRGLIDSISPYPLNGELLDPRARHYGRYAILQSPDDMDDVLYFYAARSGDEDKFDDSGRYDYIYVNEHGLRPNGRPR